MQPWHIYLQRNGKEADGLISVAEEQTKSKTLKKGEQGGFNRANFFGVDAAASRERHVENIVSCAIFTALHRA
jgi:hypothetical protein